MLASAYRGLVRSGLVALLVAGGVISLSGPALAADRPNTPVSSTPNSSLNYSFTETLASNGDVDWFKFTTTSATPRWARVQLYGLPADYRIHLYKSNGYSLVASSLRGGRADEEIYRSLPAGTYWVRVSLQAGTANPAKTYTLRFNTFAEGLRILSARSFSDSIGYMHVVGEVLNNTSYKREFIEVDMTMYNSSGQVIDTDFTYVMKDIMSPRTRAPFELIVDPPTGLARYTLRIQSDVTSSYPVGGMTLTGGVPFTDSAGTHYPGSVRNNNSYTVKFVTVVFTRYDSYGRVRDVAWTFTNPSSISSGTSATYEADANYDPSITRMAYVLDADR
jgi:hypothetical protein